MLIIDKVKVIIQGNFLFTLSPSFFKLLKINGNTKSNWKSIAIYHKCINGESTCLAK